MTPTVRPVRFADEERGRARLVRHTGPTLPHGQRVGVSDDGPRWIAARVVREPHQFSIWELVVERLP